MALVKKLRSTWNTNRGEARDHLADQNVLRYHSHNKKGVAAGIELATLPGRSWRGPRRSPCAGPRQTGHSGNACGRQEASVSGRGSGNDNTCTLYLAVVHDTQGEPLFLDGRVERLEDVRHKGSQRHLHGNRTVSGEENKSRRSEQGMIRTLATSSVILPSPILSKSRMSLTMPVASSQERPISSTHSAGPTSGERKR